MTYDISKQALQRVVSASVRCLECAVPRYLPLDEDQEYSILLSEFLIGGGDGYSMFTDELLTREIFSKFIGYMDTSPSEISLNWKYLAPA